MATLLVIGLLGLGLAALNRRVDDEPLLEAQVPEDLWAAFEAVAGPTDRSGSVVTLAGRTTVGGLLPGESGYVSSRAARRDHAGNVWLDAAAVVHPTRIDGRVEIRCERDGVHLRCPPALGALVQVDPRGHVRVVRPID